MQYLTNFQAQDRVDDPKREHVDEILDTNEDNDDDENLGCQETEPGPLAPKKAGNKRTKAVLNPEVLVVLEQCLVLEKS